MSAYGHKKRRSTEGFRPKSVKLLDQVREGMRYHHYSYKTEQAYIHWIKQYILFHDKQHPKEMGKEEIEREDDSSLFSLLVCVVVRV